MLDFEGVLHIRDGEFDEDSEPWKEHADLIEKIVFEGTVIAYENSNGVFSDLPLLTEIDGLDKLDVSRVTSMRDMFSGDSKLTTLDVSGWNTESITELDSMLFAKNIRSITLGRHTKFNRDVNLYIPEENDSYTGKWKYESDLDGHVPENPLSLTTEKLMSMHNGTKPGTYVWDMR